MKSIVWTAPGKRSYLQTIGNVSVPKFSSSFPRWTLGNFSKSQNLKQQPNQKSSANGDVAALIEIAKRTRRISLKSFKKT